MRSRFCEKLELDELRIQLRILELEMIELLDRRMWDRFLPGEEHRHDSIGRAIAYLPVEGDEIAGGRAIAPKGCNQSESLPGIETIG